MTKEGRTAKEKPDKAASRRTRKPVGEPAAVEAAANDRAFDHWLQQQLESYYGEIVDEPVPQSMIDLIKRHRKPD